MSHIILFEWFYEKNVDVRTFFLKKPVLYLYTNLSGLGTVLLWFDCITKSYAFCKALFENEQKS